MMRRLAILTEIISPYRIPLFNALAQCEGIETHVIFLAETDPGLRQWQVPKEEIRFSYEVLPSWRGRIGNLGVLLNRGVARALRAAAPDCVLCGGYNYLASWQALLWSRSQRIPFLLWSESNIQDQRSGNPVVELLKTKFLRRCSGFVVPGKSAAQYLRQQGMRDEQIFTAPNAVDNDFFAAAAEGARGAAARHRADLGLPEKYFLFAGRLVREKGVFDLLHAYSALDAEVRASVGLVFVGDGAARADLQRQAQSMGPGVIKFCGFAQREQLAIYYALADWMILPTHTDTWGLVVNEAMACGLPVIVSRAAGCAADLVSDGCSGLLVPPQDVPALSAALKSAASRPDVGSMRYNSRQRILEYSPQGWANGVLRALEAKGAPIG